MRRCLSVLVLLGASCGGRAPLLGDGAVPVEPDGRNENTTTATFTCAGPPQLAVDGEPHAVEKVRLTNSGYGWTHVDWYQNAASGYGLYVRVGGLPGGSWVALDDRSSRVTDPHVFFGTPPPKRGTWVPYPSGSGPLDSAISGWMRALGEQDPIVELCVRLDLGSTPINHSVIEMYLRSRIADWF